MRKLLFSGFLALGVVLASQQTAPAWINWNFGGGFNWTFQSANNNWGWGAFRNGEPCSNLPSGGHGTYGGPLHGGAMYQGGFSPAPLDYGFQGPMPTPGAAPTTPAPAPAATPPVRSSLGLPVPAQQMSYPMYYQAPTYYYPMSGYGYGYYHYGW